MLSAEAKTGGSMDAVGSFSSSFFSITSCNALCGDQYQVPRDGISVPFQDVVEDGIHTGDDFYIPEVEAPLVPYYLEPSNTAAMRFAPSVLYVGIKRS
jgi:hypothetical protein